MSTRLETTIKGVAELIKMAEELDAARMAQGARISDAHGRITELSGRYADWDRKTSARLAALESLASFENISHKALVKRIEAVERQLPPAGRGGFPDQAQCGDGTTSIKPPPMARDALCTSDMRVRIPPHDETAKDNAAAARKDTLRELAVQMRTIIRKCMSGTTLDNTDCVLLTAVLDDYFGDKAGKDTP